MPAYTRALWTPHVVLILCSILAMAGMKVYIGRPAAHAATAEPRAATAKPVAKTEAQTIKHSECQAGS